MLRKVRLFLIFCLSIPCLSYGQDLNRELEDVFKFPLNSAAGKIIWLADILQSFCDVRIDSTSIKNGKFPLLLTPLSKGKKLESIKLSFSCGLLLPSMNSDSMRVSFTCKSSHMHKVQLTILGMDTTGSIVCMDTINATETREWFTFTRMVRIKETNYLRFNIQAQGGDSISKQKVWLDRIAAQVDGKNLSLYPIRDMNRSFQSDTTQIIPLSFSDTQKYNWISDLKNKRIVSVCESLHGSDTMFESAIQLMKHRVLHNNCKLLLLEMSLERAWYLNRFIQGDERFTLKDIVDISEFSIYSERMADFLLWLKVYNKTAEKKVWLWGMDVASTDFYGFATELFGYFYKINKENLNLRIKSFLYQTLTDSRKALSETLPMLLNDSNFYKSADPIEWKYIQHWWKGWMQVKDENHLLEVRDSMMYSNIKAMTNLVCSPTETVTIYSHLLHGCYDKNYTVCNESNSSYGSLLRQEYGDQYFCIGLFALQGERLLLPVNPFQYGVDICNYVNSPLPPVRINSLELLLQKVGLDYFYIPVNALPRIPVYIRVGGLQDTHSYNIIYPQKYLGGVIYIKDSKAMRVFNMDTSMAKKYNALKLKFDEYMKIVSP